MVSSGQWGYCMPTDEDIIKSCEDIIKSYLSNYKNYGKEVRECGWATDNNDSHRCSDPLGATVYILLRAANRENTGRISSAKNDAWSFGSQMVQTKLTSYM